MEGMCGANNSLKIVDAFDHCIGDGLFLFVVALMSRAAPGSGLGAFRGSGLARRRLA